MGSEKRTVDVHAGVADNLLDLTVGLEVSESLAGQAAVDLETVDKGGDGDQTVGLNILLELLGGGLVENDGVLGLVLDCRRYISQYSVRSYPTIPLVDGSEIVTGRTDGGCVPLPLDHFFFCFLPPVAAAGA